MEIWSILAATLAGMILGALWYSPVLFGNAWMQALGKTQDQLGSATGPMIGSVLACLLTAIALACLMQLAQVDSLIDGLKVGALAGVGIVFPAMLSDSLFCGWGSRLLFIQAGYRITYILVMAAILSAWPG